MSPRPMHLVMHSSHCVRVSVHGGGEIRLVTGVQCPLSTCWCWCPARGSHHTCPSPGHLTAPPPAASRARVSQQCHAFHGNNDSINIYASMLFISFDSRTSWFFQDFPYFIVWWFPKEEVPRDEWRIHGAGGSAAPLTPRLHNAICQ